MLKSLFILALSVFVIVTTAQAEMKPLADISKPTIAVFYADWCGSCKILDPNMKAAMEQIDNKDTLNIIVFDLTDDTTKAQAAAMAGENGLTDIYNDIAPTTGMAVLVKNGKEYGRLTNSDSVEDIKAKLETFVAQN